MTATSKAAARTPQLALLALTFFSACGDRSHSNSADIPQSMPASTQPDVPARDLAAITDAASWRGEVPCADCAGILTTITLYPNGTYRREGAYLGTNGSGDTVAAEFGRWTHMNEARRVRLQGSMEAPSVYAVDTDGALRMLDAQGNDIISNANHRLTAISEAIELTHPARITAAFTYLADAAHIVECRSGLQYPVEMSAEFPTLQRAYADAGGNGQLRVARMGAHLGDRPAMEGDATTISLVVDSAHSINASDGCAALRTQDSLAGSTWRLVALEGANARPLVVPENTEAGFMWGRSETRLTGSGGCNRFSARGVLRGTTLVGTTAAATKRYCNDPGVMEVEQRFFEVMATDIALRLESDTLVWSHGPRDVARFVRRSAYPAE